MRGHSRIHLHEIDRAVAWADAEGRLHDGDPPEGFVEKDGRHFPPGDPRLTSEDSALPAANPKPWFTETRFLAIVVAAAIIIVWGLTRSNEPNDTDQAEQFRKYMAEHAIDVASTPTIEIRAAGVVVCDRAENSQTSEIFMVGVLSSDVLDTLDLEPSRGLAPSSEETVAMAELVNVYCPGALDKLFK